MTPPSGRAPIEAIRAAAEAAVEATSLRSVAAQIGLSPTGLRNFLQGRSPYSATVRKLNAWYLKHAAQRHAFTDEVVEAAFAVLLEGLPEEARPSAAQRVLGALDEGHREAHSRPPAWLHRFHLPPREP